MKDHYQIVIIGAGTAGIMVASQLKRKNKNLDIAILDPAQFHYYQPAWTLVGAGTYSYEKTKRATSSLIPSGVDWIEDKCTGFLPDDNKIVTAQNGEIGYDYLVVAPGIKIDTSLIEGLPEAIDKGLVCSNYTDPEHTWEVLRNFKGGNALFTQPGTPIKCGGAPQKIAYLAADYFRKHGLAKNTNTIFATPGSVIFGVPCIKKTLTKVLKRYDMHFKPFHTPYKIDAEKQIAYFRYTKPEGKIEDVLIDQNLGEYITEEDTVAIPFDMLHLAPPQGPPDFIKNSTLSNEGGWFDVDQYTMQHKRHLNIFGLGDAAGLPTAKTGAAIRKQAPIVVANILKMMESGAITNMEYNGYSSCPLVTGYGKMVLAEFDYDNKFTPDPKLKQMLIFDSSKEHWRLWMLKKYMLPYLYWNKMMRGQDV